MDGYAPADFGRPTYAARCLFYIYLLSSLAIPVYNPCPNFTPTQDAS